jgi:transposase
MKSLAVIPNKTAAEYEVEIASLHLVNKGLRRTVAILEEKIRYLLHQRFGASSEQLNLDQLSLLESANKTEIEPLPSFLPSNETDSIPRKRGGRRRPPANLPRKRVVIDLPEDAKHCSCGAFKQVIREECSEQYQMEPAKFWVQETARLVYACPRCNTAPVTAPAPLAPLPKTQTSPSLLANIGVSKFVDGLPLHRQARILEQRFGVSFTTTTMSTWMIMVAESLLRPLIQAMLPTLLSCDYWHMDETRLQVLNEPKRTAKQLSWLWVRATGAGIPIIVFDYSPSRGGQTATRLLEDFTGYLQSDALGSYDVGAGPEIIHLGCWSHARRKFVDVAKSAEKDQLPPLAVQALSYIRRLYQIDAEVKGQPADVRHAHRQLHSLPLIEAFQHWLDDNLAVGLAAGGKLATAFTYLHNQWPKLIRFLEDGRLELDNNAAERSIRPVAIGRKNWLFCNSEKGAGATATWYSVVETAKANGWEPYHYLHRILTEIPTYLDEGRSLEPLLPWNLRPPSIPLRE